MSELGHSKIYNQKHVLLNLNKNTFCTNEKKKKKKKKKSLSVTM